MDMETLNNELLTVEVSDLGAELQSIKDDEGKEYLWQGDDRYWALVGSLDAALAIIEPLKEQA